MFSKFIHRNLYFWLILSALAILYGIFWLTLHESHPAISDRLTHACLILAVMVVVGKVAILVNEREKSSLKWLISFWIAYGLLILFLAIITLGSWYLLVSGAKPLWITILITLFMTGLTALSIFKLIDQIQTFRGKAMNDTELENYIKENFMTHIIPAIDLQNGQAVRLYKGDYDQKTIYSDQPEALAAQFETMGAEYLHLVDLDGAKAGTTANLETIRKIKQATKLKIELGGGIRDLETVSLYLDDVKLARVILGTAALENPVFLKAALAKYGAEKIVVGVDIKDGNVATAGWLETFSTPYLDFLHELENIGVTTTVITDISKDGTLTGPNFALYEEIARETKLNFVVSGGVKDATDIKQAQKADFYGIIVGKAYYEGKIDLEKVLKS